MTWIHTWQPKANESAPFIIKQKQYHPFSLPTDDVRMSLSQVLLVTFMPMYKQSLDKIVNILSNILLAGGHRTQKGY